MTIASQKKAEAPRQGTATLLALALLPLSGFATDIYLLFMPSMGAALHVGGLQIQLTLSFCLDQRNLSYSYFVLALLSAVLLGGLAKHLTKAKPRVHTSTCSQAGKMPTASRSIAKNG